MKKVFMALAMIAIAHYSAEAQNNRNYKVCKYNSGYATCGNEHKTNAANDEQTTNTKNWTAATSKASKGTQNYKVCKYNAGYATCGKEGLKAKAPAPVAPNPNVVETTLQTTGPVSYTYYDRMVSRYNQPRHHVIVYSDSMNAPYKGEESRQNDGVAKNEYRNLNYQLATADLPPSTGSFTK